MRRKKRGRAQIVLLVVLAAAAALMLLIRMRLFPMAEELAVTQVTNKTSNLINDAIDRQIRRGEVDYDSMVLLEKDGDGNVTALKTNISEINRLKTQILDTLNKEIMELDVDQIGVPLGNLVAPEWFSGHGPYLPVRVLSIRSSDAGFENQFFQAGINQTLHQIVMNISVQMMIVTPAGTRMVETASQVVIAETVIVGTVPSSYLSLEPTGPAA